MDGQLAQLPAVALHRDHGQGEAAPLERAAPAHRLDGRCPLGIAIVLDGANPTSEAYDEGRVTERLLIAARSRGLGGGVAWYGDAAQQAGAKEILGIPEDRTARAVVLIGYPVSTTDPRPTRAQPGRKPLSELVSYDRWGAPRA